MRKNLFISLFVAAAFVAVFASGCVKEDLDIQATFVPASTAEPTYTEIPLPLNMVFEEKICADLNNNGIEETITFYSTHSDDANKYLTIITISGSTEKYTEIIDDCEYISSYIIQAPGGNVCLLISLTDPVAYSSYIYSFDGIKPIYLCCLGHITGISGTEITQEGRVDAFGSWHYSRTYELNDDLSLMRGEYQIIMDDKEPLHTIEMLPVELLAEGVYTKGYIEAGRDIIPVSTDRDSYLKFRLEDGSEGRIMFSRQDYAIYIDGKSEDKYFDNIDYTDMWY